MKRLALSVAIAACAALMLLPMQASGAINVSLSGTAVPFPLGGSYVSLSAPVGPADLKNSSYARFWVDLPLAQIVSPQAFYTCAQAGSPVSCRYIGTAQKYDSRPYSKNGLYSGSSGVRIAAVQIWRKQSGDPTPIFMGQDLALVTIP